MLLQLAYSPISAAIILLELGDISRFESPDKILAFASLEPGHFPSGTSVYQKGFFKMSNDFYLSVGIDVGADFSFMSIDECTRMRFVYGYFIVILNHKNIKHISSPKNDYITKMYAKHLNCLLSFAYFQD